MEPVRHLEDCVRISRLALNLGYNCLLYEAEQLWEKHSEEFSAGWLELPKEDSSIKFVIEQYYKKRGEANE